MIKLRGHHLIFIIEHHKDGFLRAEEILKKTLKRDHRGRLYDDPSVKKMIQFSRDLVANPEQEFQVIIDEPDDLCKLCCNYDNNTSSGCKNDPDSEPFFVFSEDYTSLARMSSSGDNWVPGSIRRIREVLAYLPKNSS